MAAKLISTDDAIVGLNDIWSFNTSLQPDLEMNCPDSTDFPILRIKVVMTGLFGHLWSCARAGDICQQHGTCMCYVTLL